MLLWSCGELRPSVWVRVIVTIQAIIEKLLFEN